ncbi:SseB family protein [Spirillospora sp. CA-128828]|uniref:SseB family protein n=1 Tax=Spirillospora sp. CA-128828 TaxID=3240033 RepID=UPI003D8D7AE6
MADAWQPTSELERRLQETVRAGDQESYFRLIADSELVVPVPPEMVDGVLAGETQPSWPTQEEDGRVHVLVYTSAAAMRACLGPSVQHFMTVRFGDIAETWPDARWWLAIDAPARGVGAALPIEARLPSWFVRQVAEGDGRPPQVGRASAPWEELSGQHRELPRETARSEFQPANDVERELLRAAANNDHDLFLQTLAGTEVLLPVPDDMDFTLRPGRPGFPWQTRKVDGSTVVPVFTSPERLAEAAGSGTESIMLPFTVVLRYWPNHDWLLAINSGSPAGGTVLAQQLPGLATWADQRAAQRMTERFEPQNDIEQRLFDAARRRDTEGFFTILLGAQVLVPADADTPWGIVPGDREFPWRPIPVHGRTSIQIFTSLKWMNEAIGSSRFIMPSVQEMVGAWPDGAWTLVLNPGTPIDASMPGEQVRTLRGPATPPSAATPPPPETPAVPVAPAVPSPGPAPDPMVAGGPAQATPGEPGGRHADAAPGEQSSGIPAMPEQPGLPTPGTPEHPTRHHDLPQTDPASAHDTTPPGEQASNMPAMPEQAAPPAPGTPGRPAPRHGVPQAGAPDGRDTPVPGEQVPGMPTMPGQAGAPAPHEAPGSTPPANEPGESTPSTPGEAVGRHGGAPHDPVSGPAPGGPGEERPAQSWHAKAAPEMATPGRPTPYDLPQAGAAPGRDTTPPGEQASNMPATPEQAAAPATPVHPAPHHHDVPPAGAPGGHDTAVPGEQSSDVPAMPDQAGQPAPGTPGRPTPQHDVPQADPAGGRDAAGPGEQSSGIPAMPDQAGPPAPHEAPGSTPPANEPGESTPSTPGEAAGRHGGAPHDPVSGPATGRPGEEHPAQARHTNAPPEKPAPGTPEPSAPHHDLPPAGAAGGHDTTAPGEQASGIPAMPEQPGLPTPGTPDHPARHHDAAIPGEQASAMPEQATPLTPGRPVQPGPQHDAPQVGAAGGRDTTLPGGQAPGIPVVPEQAGPSAPHEAPGGHAGAPPTPSTAGETRDPARTPPVNEPGGMASGAGGRHSGMPQMTTSPGDTAGHRIIDHGVAEEAVPGVHAPGGPADGAREAGRGQTGGPGAVHGGAQSGSVGEQEAAPPGPGSGDRPERALRAVEEPEPAFEPGNRIDQELYEAAASGDSDAFLRVLLNANVLVPIPADAPLEVTPVQQEFRWDAALRSGSAVQVFTSLVRLREVLPESRFVYADFRELIGAWPREDWAMVLNPGTRIGASLRGDQVQALSDWAVRVGLVPARPEVPLPPPRREPAPQTAPDPDDRVATPTIMQKVVPHGHVAWYLEQGYDRVGGFVHSTGDVAELQTPVQLYETLGLLYADSPFSAADEGVYVIRWPAYCPDLYRVPFGGRTEEEMAAWGEAGWVVERPPFLGSGFAPGSAGSIREYKVDSVRLPYGAEMYYLARDRSERFIAMYDPDRLAWLRPDANAEAWNGRTEATQ